MNITKNLLYELLYEKTNQELILYLSAVNDYQLLHMIAVNYNWDNGISVPECISNHPNCDLGTALLLFELADGYIFLMGDSENILTGELTAFLSALKRRIEQRDFAHQSIRYVPDFTRAMKYQIRKACPVVDAVFIEGTEGETLEIITV